MKKLLLFILVVVCMSCDRKDYESVAFIVTEVQTQEGGYPVAYHPDKYVKYKVFVRTAHAWLYTDTQYKPGDTLK
jgi:hypothetical protein